MQNDTFCPQHGTTLLLKGHILAGMAYGIVLILFILCSQLLISRVRSPNTRTRQGILLLAYVIYIFVLCTLMITLNAHYVQGYVQSSCAPTLDNPAARSAVGSIGGAFGDTFYVLTNWAVDGLLIWRCLVIYHGSRARHWIICVSILMGISSFVVGFLLIFTAFGVSVVPLFLEQVLWIHSSVSLAINTVITAVIAARLLIYRSRVTKLLGSEHGSHFITIINMMIESAAHVTIYFIAVLVMSAVNTEYLVVPLQALPQVQAVASLWIIFRAAQGKAWAEDTSKEFVISRSVAFKSEDLESGNIS